MPEYFVRCSAFTGPQPSSSILAFLPMLLILGIFYFLLFMPMQRQKKQQQQMLAASRTGTLYKRQAASWEPSFL